MFLSAASIRNTALRRISTQCLRIPQTKTAAVNPFLVAARAPIQQFRFFSDEEVASIIKGQVKWFDVKKGFGFIIPENGSNDVFVHQSDIHASGFRSLAEGEEVEFEVVEEGDGRRKAKGVTGPDGVHVQGAPRDSNYDDSGGDGWNDRF